MEKALGRPYRTPLILISSGALTFLAATLLALVANAHSSLYAVTAGVITMFLAALVMFMGLLGTALVWVREEEIKYNASRKPYGTPSPPK
ncbi:MAG: hypothetical protein KW788_04440 [Candidatus Doudnabacteria bacterium]|nr:hypothetical protein [Candidatus Doudnabacteria bacterium]